MNKYANKIYGTNRNENICGYRRFTRSVLVVIYTHLLEHKSPLGVSFIVAPLQNNAHRNAISNLP